MNEPLKNGDVCIIIDGLTKNKSPNIGKMVVVGRRVFGNHGMDHERFGPVHHCKGKGIMQLGDNGEFFDAGWADIPDMWLKKIDPNKTLIQLERVLEKTE